MSENIESLENTDTTVENAEGIEQGVSLDELADMLALDDVDLTLDTENLFGIMIDEKAFAKGVKSISELCGKFVALRTAGMSSEDSASLLISRETAQHNLELARIQETQAKISQELNSI